MKNTRKNGEKGWPTKKGDLALALSIIFYYNNISELLNEQEFSKRFKRIVKT
jgi:hypothetical protein